MAVYNYTKLIRADKLQDEIIGAGLSTITFIDTVENEITIHFSEELTSEQQTLLESLVVNHQLVDTEEYIRNLLKSAMQFGDRIVLDFATENVLMGITAAGKTGAVSDYLHKLTHYLTTGSLYEAINKIDEHVADNSETKTNLSPFVTNERLTYYKEKIEEYLGL